MKVGAKITLFNYVMRCRRKELGLTQKELAYQAGVSLLDITNIELLKTVTGRIPVVAEKLARVAVTLHMDFNELFPKDYLEALEQNKLPPSRSRPFLWMREVSLDQLLDSGEIDPDQLLLPSPDQLFDQSNLPEAIASILATLPDRERRVIEMRFGFGSGKKMTLQEVGDAMGIGRARVRQIESKALRRLRHPGHLRHIRGYLKKEKRDL